MIFKLALRNIIGYGWRSMINVFIIALLLIGLIWMEGMWFSWLRLARSQQQEWEFGKGMLRVASYDPYDTFTWEKGYAPIPEQALPAIEAGRIVPILFSPGVVYTNGIMMNAVIKGLPSRQKLLKFPTQNLGNPTDGNIPVIVGKAMARSSKLKAGDVFTLRFKDSSGAFNTIDAHLVKVIDCPVPSLDIGTVWMDLAALQSVKQLPQMTTVMVLDDPALASVGSSEFKEITAKEFFADLDKIFKAKAGGQSGLFIMLILLAMLAVFDTQALAIFKRRKEIGMLAAMGMTKAQIIRLFTMEGALYMLLATLASLVLGFPLFWYFAVKGFTLPAGTDGFGMIGFNEPLKFVFPIPLILATLILIFLLTLFVSWLPARRISRMNPTDALRGKEHA